MTNLTLEKLVKQREQLVARIKAIEAKTSEKERKNDVRRKILVGAYFLNQHETSGTMDEFVKNELDQFLFRAADRALFGLPPRAVATA